MATTFCFAQSVTLSGVVLNEQGAPISNVSVVIKKASIIKAYTIADNKGIFKINILPGVDYIIGFTCVGYEPMNEKIILKENKQTTFTLKLRTTVEDTVRITPQIGIYERGDTIFYNADVFKRNNEDNLADLLKNTPGFRVMPNGKVMIGDDIINKVTIDSKDLTGENYEKIINNLSPHNIDQIQVLKKYKDPFDLSKTATGDTEYALNLTFKKKRIIPTAKVQLGVGVPLDYYEYKTDFLVLTKPITSINFANLNTVGRTAQLINSPNSLFGNFTPEIFSKLGKGLPYLNTVPELSLKISKQDYSFNNTNFFDNSSQFNIGKKITNKFSVNYTKERIEQVQQFFSTTFIDSQILAQTTSSNTPLIDRDVLTVKNELIWMIKKNEQLKWNLSALTENDNSSNNSLLNSKPVLFQNKNKQSFVNSLFSYTKFLRNATVINLVSFFDRQSNEERLENDGIIYQKDIIPTGLDAVKSLQQNTAAIEKNYGTYIKLIKRKRDFSFTFQPTWKKIDGGIATSLSAQTISNNNYSNVDSFNNDNGYSQTWLSFPIRYKYDNSNFAIDVNLEPIYLHSLVYRIENNITDFNARISSNYQFANKRRFSISVGRRNDFTILSRLRENNIIVDNKNKLVGTNFLLTDKSYTAFMAYNKYGIRDRRPIFNYSISANLNSPNYILNTTNNNFYSLQNYINGSITNKGINASVRNTIRPLKLKSTLENSLSFSSRKFNNSQNDIVFTSISNNVTLDSKVNSTFNGAFNFSLTNILTYGYNKRIGSKQSNKNLSDVAGLEINFNYKKRSNVDFEIRNYHFNTINNPTQNVMLANLSYKQLIKNNKIRLALELRNITDKKAFTSQNLSVTQFYENRVELLPRIALFKIEFLL